jgi:hypothetical protein
MAKVIGVLQKTNVSLPDLRKKVSMFTTIIHPDPTMLLDIEQRHWLIQSWFEASST